MGISCTLGFHNWDNCKCSKCGKIRDEGHNWDGCKCTKCGKTRDEGHDWSKDCEKCAKCGTTRENDHDWSKDCEKCPKCGATRQNAHQWDGCKCTKCGKTRDEGHDWSKNRERCSKCGISQIKYEREEHPVLPPPYSSIKNTKKIYSAPNKEAAISFLSRQNVTEPFYYIEVDTPSGRFGIDNGGRIYDRYGNFIEPEPEPVKVDYDEETIKIKSQLEAAMEQKRKLLPRDIMEMGGRVLKSLQVIIEDDAADFYIRRMAVWWGAQFNDASFNVFLKKRFVEGKDRAKLYEKTESSQSEVARAEEGLHIATVDVLSGQWKP